MFKTVFGKSKNKSTIKQSFLGTGRQILLAVLLVAASFSYMGARSFADSYQLYVSPATSTVTTGSNFIASIRLNPGTAVDGVMATLTYDPALLQYVSIDTTASAFPVQLSSQISSGTINIIRGIFPPDMVNNDSLVATITFKALTKTSATSIGLTGNTTNDQGDYTNPTTGGASVTVNDPSSGDTTPPSVTIVSPAPQMSTRGSFKISASAKDNVKVTRMEIYGDDTLIDSVDNGSVGYSWKLPSSAVGAHSIVVKAYDAAGNIGSATVAVNKVASYSLLQAISNFLLYGIL